MKRTKRNRVRYPKHTGRICPRCGKPLQKTSGMRRCAPCGYTAEMQIFDRREKDQGHVLTPRDPVERIYGDKIKQSAPLDEHIRRKK